MSADELPADMEAIEWRIQQDMDDVSDVWRHCRIAFVDAADPDDVVGFPSFTKTDLRALLKAYQEQRRALEAASPVVPVGVSREVVENLRRQRDHPTSDTLGFTTIRTCDADAILAALRPTDTGREA